LLGFFIEKRGKYSEEHHLLWIFDGVGWLFAIS
jgi:hypothetical protein